MGRACGVPVGSVAQGSLCSTTEGAPCGQLTAGTSETYLTAVFLSHVPVKTQSTW